MQLEPKHVARMDDLIAQGIPLPVAFPNSIGGKEACDGLWRFYSDSWPTGGVELWNTTSLWKRAWASYLNLEVFTFGEDVFGNQLAFVPGHNHVWLWNHENGDQESLHVDAATLLTIVLREGIDWIDQYQNGSLTVAREFGHVGRNSHLHWTTPLILGGIVNASNVSVVERESHLIGHAKLWSQVCDLPPGISQTSS